MKMADEKGLLYVNGYDHPHIIAGAGTMGLEILEQVPDVDAIIVPLGGGGLIAGVAMAVKVRHKYFTCTNVWLIIVKLHSRHLNLQL
jgi:threonine dehydratase